MPSKKTVVAAAAAMAAMPATQAQIFTVNCAPLTVQRADPIVQPGGLSGHVHAVVGGTAFQFTMGEDTAVNAKETTCDKILDQSNYWQPQLYHQNKDGKFEMVEFQGAVAYYLDRTCDYEAGRQNCDGAPKPIAPPPNLRMVVGNPFRKDYDSNNKEHQAISHVCLEPASDTPELPKACSRMRAETYFPACWNGKDLDSEDHKSHMAFPEDGAYNTGVCPESHPTAIFSVFYEFFYDTGKFTDNFNRWVWAQGDTVGYGLHGDYLQGWTDQPRLEDSITTCTGDGGINSPSCSLNVGPNGTPGESGRKDLEVAAPTEEIGFNGPLDKLPGDNPLFKRSMRERYN
ncbi:hypothetical protein N3K66_006360 [Trichothecium roseum]|uniref:Uncharacterized protein n=1 Tax=Trichothecium roseum TaxID=47278 RepID=A0ACC0UWU2_9HYPO|nr:hypothetical protein N3K66_006360 [Trichothecium roseum]